MRVFNEKNNHEHFYSAVQASKSPARVPCTNRLVLCQSHSQIVWSYNIGLHYETFHLGMKKAIYESLVATRAELMSILAIRRKKSSKKFYLVMW